MRLVKFTVTLLVSVIIFQSATAQEKYSRVKVYAPNDIQKKRELIGLLEIDHFSTTEDGAIVSEIGAHNVQDLKRSGYRYEILVDDVTAQFQKESKAYFESVKKGSEKVRVNNMAFEQSCQSLSSVILTPSLFSTNNVPQGSMGGFYTYAEMVTKIDQLVSLYPTIVQKLNLGSSIEGRTIWAVKISDNVALDEAEPEVLFTALQHAREAITGTSMIFFMQYLAENYASDLRVQQLVNSREIYIVPCVNPDGYVYNQTTNPGGGGNHRKNRRPNNGTNPGVDLNRNYGVDWANCAGATASCGSGSNTGDTYWGTSAFSEPETQAIRNLVTTRNFVASIDQHCVGPYYSLPFGRPSLHTMNALDTKFYTYVPALMGKYNGMRAGNSPQTVNYEVAGGIKDWLLMGDIGMGSKGKIYGMTGEGGGGGTTGFWAPSGQIINLCRGMTFQNIQLALTAGSYHEIVDMDDIAMTATSGVLDFRLRRIGLTNAPVTVSVVKMENIATVGAPVVINSMPNYYDVVNNSISYTLPPGITSGQRIKFVWKVESGGITTYDTITKIYNPFVMVTDDMDAGAVGAKWTITNGFGYSTANAFSGTRSLSESPTGNYTTNSTRTAQSNTNLDLSTATAAYISFMVRHRSENFRDKLQMEVSTNGTTWIPVCGKNPVQEPNIDGSTLGGQPALTGWREEWYQEIIDLKDYLGQANLRFRFEFTSDNDASAYFYETDEGFSIDNFRAIRTNATLITLPVDFLGVQGKLLSPSAIQVSWDAVLNGQHNYFEVEKSTDGYKFSAIGRVIEHESYLFTDKTPASGNNYYRIKQVDKDGKATYSKTVNVINTAKVKVSIYPNPVIDQLNIRFDEQKSSSYIAYVYDMQGRQVHKEIYNGSGTGRDNIVINTSRWVPNVYQLKIVNDKGETVSIQKFIKQ